MTPSSSSHTVQSDNDFGRYKRVRVSPQVAEAPIPIQPEEPINISPVNIQPANIQPVNTGQNIFENLTQTNKESDSDNETENWSFDRAINEVFWLLPEELSPKTQQEQTPTKPLSGIEQLMESSYLPLLVLPQSKLVENTTKYIQNRLDAEKCCRDWICPQNLVSALAPMKFYKSQNQFLPTDNVPPLEADSSLLDLSYKGRASIPIKNLEAWEKKARKLIAINSHADLFSSAAFLCLQQESMSVTALSRLLEAVAKSIKHTTAMSTILTTEIFQVRRDAALASSKLLMDNSRGWSGGAKVLWILHHWGVQLILAYSWARPAILVVGKGRGGMFLFLLFLHFHSCSSIFPVPLFHLLYSLFLSLFSLSLGDDTKWPSRVDVSLNPNTINQSWII